MSESKELVLATKLKAVEKALADLDAFTNGGNSSSSKKKGRGKEEKLRRAFELFTRMSEGMGRSEYDYEPYNDVQMLEKYKAAVTEGWNGKQVNTDSIPQITSTEIEQGNDDREKRMAALQNRRERQAIEAAEARKLLKDIGDHNSDEEPDADEIVEQALNGRRPKSRPALITGTYTTLDGRTIKRQIAASAYTKEIDNDDYRGYQHGLLSQDKDDDSPEPSNEDTATRYQKGLDDRRRINEQRDARIKAAAAATATAKNK